MTNPHALARFSVYRDRRPFSPHFLGDVLAHDAEHARQLGRAAFGGAVVVLRVGMGTHASPELLRATAERLEAAVVQAARYAPRERADAAVELYSCPFCGTTQRLGEPCLICLEEERASATYER